MLLRCNSESCEASNSQCKNYTDFLLFLREIKVGKARVSKSDILTHLEAVNFRCL